MSPPAPVRNDNPIAKIALRLTGESGSIYTRLQLLTSGGQGFVLLGWNREMGEVIIKLSQSGGEIALSREWGVNRWGIRESGRYAKLIDWGWRGEDQFLVFRKVRGKLWKEVSFQTLEELAERISAVGEALLELHARGWVHGDISPRNVLVGDQGEVVVIDLGLSSWRGDMVRGGTPKFRAPGTSMEPNRDLYSLVRLFQESLRKLPPSQRKRWQQERTGVEFVKQVLSSQTQGPPPSLGEFCRLLERVTGKRERLQFTSQLALRESESEREAWDEFLKIARRLPEYYSSEEETSFTPFRTRILLQWDLQDAMRGAELLERWGFGRRTNPQDRRLVASFSNSFSKHLLPRGRIVEATRFAMLGIEILEEVGEGSREDLLEVSRRLNVNGGLFAMLGRPVETICALMKALYLRKRLEPADSPLLAQSWNNLAGALRVEALQPSVAMQLRSKQIWGESLGENSNDVAWANSNLGRLQSQQGEHDAAAMLIKESLRLKRRLLGESHPQVATVLLNRGEQLSACREFRKAERCFREALNIRQTWYGRMNSNTLRVVEEWTRSALRSGETERAERILKDQIDGGWEWMQDPGSRAIRQMRWEVSHKLRRRAEERRLRSIIRGDTALFRTPRQQPVSYQTIFERLRSWLPEEGCVEIREDVEELVFEDLTCWMKPRRLEPRDFLRG